MKARIVLDDAHGNRVEVEADDASLYGVGDLARSLYDHIKTTPAVGPASGGQQIGFRNTDPQVAYMRYGETPAVNA